MNTVVYPVSYQDGFDWWKGTKKDTPLPAMGTEPFVIYIHEINRKNLFKSLACIGFMLAQHDCKGIIWRSTCDVVIKWSKLEDEASSICEDKHGLRWYGDPSIKSRFRRVCMTALMHEANLSK